MQTVRAVCNDTKGLIGWLKGLNPITISVLFYIFGVVADYASTKFCEARHIPDMIETNQFTRDANMMFVLHKALVVDALYLTLIAMTAFCVYNALRRWNEHVATFVVCFGFIYVTYDRLYSAVLSNVLYGLRFYVASSHDGGFNLFFK